MTEPDLDCRKLGPLLEILRIQVRSPADKPDALLQLRRIIEHCPTLPETAEAIRLFEAFSPRSPEDPRKIADLRIAWADLSGPGHSNAPAVIHNIFESTLPEGEQITQLRRRVFRALPAFLAELESGARATTPKRGPTNEHLRRLIAELTRATQIPDYQSFAADVERLTEFAARRAAAENEAAFAAAEQTIAAALARWDVQGAMAAWSTLPRLVADAEPRRAALETAIAAVTRLANDASEAIHSLVARAEAFGAFAARGHPAPADLDQLAGSVTRLDALLADRTVPPKIAAKADAARTAMTTAALAWAENAARRIDDLDGLAQYAGDFARLPEQWQALARRSWFDEAWHAALAGLRHTINAAADAPDLWKRVQAVVPRLERLPAVLRVEAKAASDVLRSLVTAWLAVADGALPALPNLEPLGDAVFLPAAYRTQHDQVASFTQACHVLRERISGIDDNTQLGDIDAIAKDVDALAGRFGQFASRLGELHGSLTYKRDVVAVSSALRRLDVAAIVQRAAQPGADRRLAMLKDRVTALRSVASLMGEQLAEPAALIEWLPKWIAAVRELGNAEDLPAALEDHVAAVTGQRLASLVAGCEAMLQSSTTTTTTSHDLHRWADQLDALPWFGQLRALRRQFLRAALGVDFNVAAAAKNFAAINRILHGLHDFEEDPDVIAAFDLRARLLRQPSPSDRSAAIFAAWWEIVRLLPDQIVPLVLEAARHEDALDTLSPHHRSLREHLTTALGAPAAAEDKQELQFWSEWTGIEADLNQRADRDALIRCAEFWLSRRDESFRRFIEAGIVKFVRAWSDRNYHLGLCWVSQLFPRVFRRFSQSDPVAELDRASRHLADETREIIRAERDLTETVFRGSRARLQAALDDWSVLSDTLENSAVRLEGFKGPNALAGGIEAIKDLETVVRELADLLDEDFSDLGTFAKVESCRFRLLRLNDIYGPIAGFRALSDELDRIYQACDVRGPWEDFDAICRRDWISSPAEGGLRSAAGLRSLEDADRTARQINSVLQRSAMTQSRCADRLAARAVGLAKWGPIVLQKDRRGWQPVLASIENYLIEFRQQRSLISVIERELPPGGITRPDDPHYATFWRHFPTSPPRGAASLLLWEEFGQRDGIATTYSSGANRVPQWLLELTEAQRLAGLALRMIRA